jgi:hypothetical protein
MMPYTRAICTTVSKIAAVIILSDAREIPYASICGVGFPKFHPGTQFVGIK